MESYFLSQWTVTQRYSIPFGQLLIDLGLLMLASYSHAALSGVSLLIFHNLDISKLLAEVLIGGINSIK
ncbi:MAG: hypothetical protein ACPGEF_00135 [Endozoicomonas sp.]